jgi:hypothetical protein
MEPKDLNVIGDILESLNEEVTSINRGVTSIKKGLEAQPQTKDYSVQLENALAAVQTLGAQVTKLGTQVEKLAATPVSATPALDLAAFTQEVQEVVREEVKRHHPGYTVTKWVQYGAVALIATSLLAIISIVGWWQAVQSRDHYVRSNWFWRASQQSNRHFANGLLNKWHQDSVKFQQDLEQLEANDLLLLQADRKKLEEAALRAQAAHNKKR